ncbi:hypothetical protein Emag_007809 [Eimeria magna]
MTTIQYSYSQRRLLRAPRIRRSAIRHPPSVAALASHAAGAPSAADNTHAQRAPSRASTGILGRSYPPPEPAAAARSHAAQRPQHSGSPDSCTRAIRGPVVLLQCPRPRPSYLPLLPAGTLASKCPACRAPGFRPASCPRRQYFFRSTRFPYLEVDRFGHSYYIRPDLPSPACFHPGLLRAVLVHERPAPQAPPQPSVALLQHHPGALPTPATTDPRPTSPPPAEAPAAPQAVFCAAPSTPSAPPAPPAICNHTHLGTPPRTPDTPTQKDIARDTRNQASAADRLNDLQYVARLAINFDTLARTYPGRGEHRPQDADTLTLNDYFYAPLAAADPPTNTPAAPRAPATPPARRPQRTAPTPSELLRQPPPASWAAAIHHLNQQAPRAPPQPSALNSPVDMPRPPAPSLGPCFFCNAPDHGHRVCPSYLRACQQDPTARLHAPQQPSDALVQLHPGAADAAPSPPANADPRPTPPSPADPPAAQRAVFCAAPPAPGTSATPPAICNHTRLGTPPRTPKAPTHTRAWATIDGVRCEVIIDTGADLSLISADVLMPHRFYQPWAPAHGSVTGVNNHTLQVLGRVASKFVWALSRPRRRSSWSPALPSPPFWASISSTSTRPRPHRHPQCSRSPAALECRVTARQGRAAIHTVRLVATDSAPPPADGAADAPSYERVPGDFIPTLPSPNSCLLPAELQQLRDLLHEFRDRFNDGSEPLPATSLLKARLDTGDAQPISTPPRRLSPAMRQAVREAVAELDAQGITEPSMGCWSTPIVIIRKASGAWRLCRDYRAINKHFRIPQQPLPRTDDILASFNGEKFISVLDMCKGFYQIEIAEEDRPKTSFVTPDCQRQYRRLPFGFASSPAIFQSMVDLLLGGMKWVSAVGYIDDIIVYSDTWDPHRAHLRQLFQALRDANLQLHPEKCSFGAAAVRYVDGIKPCPSKVQAILEMPVPKTAKAVQRFLGKCQYYRRGAPEGLHVDACRRHRLARPMQGSQQFKVIHRPGAQQKHVDCLSRAPVPPTPTQRPIVLDEFPSPTVLHARAEHPAPPALSLLWCTLLCAAVNHVAHGAHRRMRLLRHRLRHMCAAARAAGAPVRPTPSGSDDDTDVQVCVTDSDDDSPTPPTAQLPDNVPHKVVHGGRNIPLPPAVERLSLKDAQAQDPECQEFLRLARTPRAAWPPHLRHPPLQFCVLHDLVYVRIGDSLPRVILPAIFRSRAIQAHHLSYHGGHFGVFKTAARLACRYWWPHLQRDVRAYFRPCPFCIANTDAPRKWKWRNLPIGAPFELIAIDLFGPLPITRRGNNHILCCDIWIRYLVSLTSRTAKSLTTSRLSAAHKMQASGLGL